MKRLLKNSRFNFATYVTTPIFYVNDKPHVGHLYTLFLADAVKKACSWKEREVFLTTGTDEHGIKVQRTAEKQGVSPIELCDKNAESFKKLANTAEIQYDDFIRTSEERHVKFVQSQWKTLLDKNLIKKTVYSGFYDTSEENFVPEKEVTYREGNAFSLSGRPLEKTTENNSMIEFSAEDKENLRKRLSEGKIEFNPESISNEIVNYETNLKVRL